MRATFLLFHNYWSIPSVVCQAVLLEITRDYVYDKKVSFIFYESMINNFTPVANTPFVLQ